MKRAFTEIISVFIFLTFSFFTQAQTYFPLVKKNAEWIDHGLWSGFNNFNHFTTKGDTVINSIKYTKVYKANNDSIVSPTSLEYMGGMREDTNRRVYYLGKVPGGLTCPTADSNEFLLYDFNLKIGDTIFGHGDSSVYSVLTNFGTEQVGSVYRKTYVFSNGSSQDRWIEGIGSAKGLFYSPCIEFHASYYLLCYFDSAVYFNNSIYGKCFAIGTEVFEEEKNEISVFPNPTSGLLSIELGNQSEIEYAVRNIQGRVIQSGNLDSKEQNEIRINGPTGLYYFQYINDSRTQIIKVVKN